MLYTFVGDLHIQPINLEKHQILFEMLEQLRHPVICPGDIFHTKELIRGECLNFLLKQLQNSSLQFTFLVGNHDLFNLHTTEHSLEALKALPNVRIIDKPQFDERTGCGFIPYIHDLGKWQEEYLKLRTQSPKLIIVHAGFTGFDYGNSYIAKNELNPNLLEGGPLVVSGHFHKYQASENLLYLGTPFSNDFAESDQDKFLAVWDSESGAIELLPTPFPKHRTLKIHCAQENPEGILETNLNELDIFRVVLSGTEEELSQFDRSKFSTVKFIEMPQIEMGAETVTTEADSHSVIFSRWAESVKRLSPDVAQLGLELLEEAG